MKISTQTDPDPYEEFRADFPQSFDTFPEPRTMPEQWDLTELMAAGQGSPGRRGSADSLTGSDWQQAHSRGSRSDDAGSDSPDWQPNRFPETRTIPRRWRFNI